MIRATGFLLGSLLVLAVFLFVLGDDVVTSPDPAPVSHAAETLPPPVEPAVAEEHPEAAVVDNVENPVAETASVDEKNWLEVTSSGLELDPETWDASLATYEKVSGNAPVPENTVQASRYKVWSPFHSKWAAEGFAQRLTQATDVPVEVINDEPGNYQVVFSYRDDAERQLLVEQIETVTGLELE